MRLENRRTWVPYLRQITERTPSSHPVVLPVRRGQPQRCSEQIHAAEPVGPSRTLQPSDHVATFHASLIAARPKDEDDPSYLLYLFRAGS